MQQQKGSDEVRVLPDLQGAGVLIGFPKILWHVCIFCLVLEGARTKEVVEELKRVWDYAAPYFTINSSDLLGWVNVFSYW